MEHIGQLVQPIVAQTIPGLRMYKSPDGKVVFTGAGRAGSQKKLAPTARPCLYIGGCFARTLATSWCTLLPLQMFLSKRDRDLNLANSISQVVFTASAFIRSHPYNNLQCFIRFRRVRFFL